MILPKGKTILENVKVQFVNFDNIINQAKKAREGRLTGYIQIVYPDKSHFLFFKNGNVINAGVLKKEGGKILPIKDVIETAKKSELGIVNIYDMPFELLFMIISSIKEKPLFKDKLVSGVNIGEFLDKLSQIKFSGFLVLKDGIKFTFVKYTDGLPSKIYIAGKGGTNVSIDVLKELMKKESEHFLLSAYQGSEEVEQAHPALISLYTKFINSLITAFSDTVGNVLVRKTLFTSIEFSQQKFDILSSIKIDDETGLLPEISISVTKEQITKAYAYLIDIFVDALFGILGRRVDDIIVDAIKDYRFALKSAGFFKNSKLSRLDI